MAADQGRDHAGEVACAGANVEEAEPATALEVEVKVLHAARIDARGREVHPGKLGAPQGWSKWPVGVAGRVVVAIAAGAEISTVDTRKGRRHLLLWLAKASIFLFKMRTPVSNITWHHFLQFASRFSWLGKPRLGASWRIFVFVLRS